MTDFPFISVDTFENKLSEINTSTEALVISLEVNTEDDVNKLASLISKDSLNFYKLTIEVADEVADAFISSFSNMSSKPTIEQLFLPNIALSRNNWNSFFKQLDGFEGLKELSLEDSNYDYTNDLKFLGEYLAKNPKLNTINLYHKNKEIDEAFKSGDKAAKLHGYLKKNTHLTSFLYSSEAHQHWKPLRQDLSTLLEKNKAKKESREKTDLNKQKYKEKLQDPKYINGLKKDLKKDIDKRVDRILKIDDTYGEVYSLGNNAISSFHSNVSVYIRLYGAIADDDTLTKDSEIESTKEEIYSYTRQFEVLDALVKMHSIEVKASDNDRPILRKLRVDCLEKWQKAAKIEDVNERNNSMGELFEGMIKDCEKASKQVKDKTSHVAIKNLLRVVTTVLMLGVPLLIHLLDNKGKAAENRSSFFCKKREKSKEGIDELSQSIEEARNNFKG